MRPLAVVSHILPPSPSGQAVMLYRLLLNWAPKDYCLLSRQNYGEDRGKQDSLPRLPAQYYHLRPEFRLKGLGRLGALEVVNILIQILQRAKNIERVVKREKCGAIIACSGDLYNLPAGYLASRWSRVPFYAYIFDDYRYQWTQSLHRYFTRCVEPIIIRGAAGVIVTNEFLRDEYRRRYRIDPTIIYNPCIDSEMSEDHNVPWPANKREINIVYTGAIYHAHFDSFRNLIAAIQLLARSDVKLHIYTAQPQATLELENICGPIVYHNHLKILHTFEVRRKADILFLALAFRSKIPKVIKTSAPGKMGEYMATARPILVHAPADSFVSWYFNEYKCGLVVDQDNPEILSQAISRILDDVKLRKKLMANARVRAQVDFNLNTAQSKFLKIFQLKKGN